MRRLESPKEPPVRDEDTQKMAVKLPCRADEPHRESVLGWEASPAERELSPQNYRPFTLSRGSEVHTLLPNTSTSLLTPMCSEGDPVARELIRLQHELEREHTLRRKAEADLQIAETTIATLRESETYFRHLTEYSLDLIIVLDPDGSVRFESHSVFSELGYTPEEHLGQSAFEFIHPEDQPRVIEAFKKAVQTHGSTGLISFRARHKEGGYRILE